MHVNLVWLMRLPCIGVKWICRDADSVCDFPLSIIYGVFYHFTHWKHTNWFLTSSFIWRNEISWNLLWQLDLRFASQMIILIFSAIQNVFQCIFHSHTHTHRHKKKFSNLQTTGIMPFSIASQEKFMQVFPYKAFIDFVNCIFNVICVTSKDVILHVLQSLRIGRDKKKRFQCSNAILCKMIALNKADIV